MAKEQWTTVIEAESGFLDLRLKEIFHYYDLLALFIRRDFVSQFKQTILGPFWFIIQPLVSTLVFTVIFGQIAKIPTDGIPQPVFYMSGLIFWGLFSACLNATSGTFLGHSALFSKVYFPRLIVPISMVFSQLLKFSIQFVSFIGLYLFFFFSTDTFVPNIWILYLPIGLLQALALGFGVGLFISSVTTKYRDVTFLIGFGIQLWMYATPIVYPSSQLSGVFKWLMVINPMAPVIEVIKYGFFGVNPVELYSIGISLALTVLILFFSLVLFNRTEKTFIDRI